MKIFLITLLSLVGFVLSNYSARKCPHNHCLNGGTCLVKSKKTMCICTRNYTGKICDQPHPCSKNVCKNGGKCFPYYKYYYCYCRNGYKGVNCTRHMCVPNPCRNGGRCIAKYGKYMCKCPYYFKGKNCEHFKCSRKTCKHGKKCNKHGCICKKNYEGRLCNKVKRCRCFAFGDPHYNTFDGQMIHFMGVCKYTMVQSNGKFKFAVEVKNEHRGRNKRVSYTRMVDVKLPHTTLRLLHGSKVLVNGSHVTLPLRSKTFSVEHFGRSVKVVTKFKLTVIFDGVSTVIVSIPKKYGRNLIGICGNCNGKKDDFRTKDGKDVSRKRNKYSLIGMSYQVPDDSDKPDVKCNVSDVITKCTKHEVRKCNNMNNVIFKTCKEALHREFRGIIKSCKIDICIYKNTPYFHEAFCDAMKGLVSRCEDMGFPVNWRTKFNCPMECGKNQFYQYDALKCQPSCIKRRPRCKEIGEACVCNIGYILSGDECVPIKECGCKYKYYYLKVGGKLVTCRKIIICIRRGKLKIKYFRRCKKNRICVVKNNVRKCICKRGYVDDNGRCIPKKTTIPATIPTTVPTTVPTTIRTTTTTTTTTIPTTVPTTIPTTLPTIPTTVPTTIPTTGPITGPITVPTTIPTTVPRTVPRTVPITIPTTAPSTVKPPTPGRIIRGSFIIIIDISGGITRPNFIRMINFIIRIINIFDISSSNIRIGVLGFSKTVFFKIGLGTYTNRKRLIFHINLLRYIRLYHKRCITVNFHLVLRHLMRIFGMVRNHYYRCMPKYAFLITYSRSIYYRKTRTSVKLLRNRGITVFVIGIGKCIYARELRLIASRPHYQFLFLTNFRRLFYIIKIIRQQILGDMDRLYLCHFCRYGCYCLPACYSYLHTPSCCRSSHDCNRSAPICWKGYCRSRCRK